MRVAFLDSVHPLLNDRLEAAGFDLLDRTTQSPDDLRVECAQWDGIVIRSRVPMDRDFLSQCASLKFIARSGAGLENIDLVYCQERGIKVYSAAEGNRDAVGEHALGMLLALWNRLREGDQEVRKGIWRREENRGREIAGKTIGILGYGRMGSAFADKLQGFSCQVLAHDRYRKGFGNDYVAEVPLEILWQESDVLSIHIDQRPGNHHFVDEVFLNRFAKPITLINTGRGSTLDTEALVQAMRSGRVDGACLDVYEYEKRSFETLELDELPAPFRYLVASERTILSPHVAGWTSESYVKLSEVLAMKILAEFQA